MTGKWLYNCFLLPQVQEERRSRESSSQSAGSASQFGGEMSLVGGASAGPGVSSPTKPWQWLCESNHCAVAAYQERQSRLQGSHQDRSSEERAECFDPTIIRNTKQNLLLTEMAPGPRSKEPQESVWYPRRRSETMIGPNFPKSRTSQNRGVRESSPSLPSRWGLFRTQKGSGLTVWTPLYLFQLCLGPWSDPECSSILWSSSGKGGH